MKLIKVFSLFVLLHIAGWAVAHTYFSNNKPEVLVVVDTSFAMKPQFVKVQQWLEDFQASQRYKRVVVGTDKALMGPLENLKSKESIFRTAFGRMSEESLQKYRSSSASEKILLSDGSIQPAGWNVVEFK